MLLRNADIISIMSMAKNIILITKLLSLHNFTNSIFTSSNRGKGALSDAKSLKIISQFIEFFMIKK